MQLPCTYPLTTKSTFGVLRKTKVVSSLDPRDTYKQYLNSKSGNIIQSIAFSNIRLLRTLLTYDKCLNNFPNWGVRKVIQTLYIDLISFLFIYQLFACSYILIFVKVLMSAKNMSGTESAVSGSVDELALAKKLVIIVATDFACWVSNKLPVRG